MDDETPNKDDLTNFIAGTVEAIRDEVVKIHNQMATKEDLARLEGRLSERLDASSTVGSATNRG